MRYFVLAILLLANPASAAPTVSLDKEKSTVEFLAVGKPSALKIRGKGGRPEGKIVFNGSSVSGDLILNLEDFETGIKLRDRHMKEKYLETGKSEFKTAKLTLREIDLPKDFWKGSAALKTRFQGVLRLHGVEKEVTGELEFTSVSGEAVEGQAGFSMLLPDFSIAIPSFAGVTVADTVEVEVNFSGKVEGI